MTDHGTITQRINEQFLKQYDINDDGYPVPYVCVVCDRFLMYKDIKIIDVELLFVNRATLQVKEGEDVLEGLENNSSLHVPAVLKDEYTIPQNALTTDNTWISQLLLSPCATLLHKGDRWSKDGFAACNSCKHALDRKIMPKYAIANNYWFGKTPQCLQDLSRIELALLSPVKTFGYCFMYTGGVQMKGSLSYYKVAHESIARTLTKMEVLGLNNDIVVILYGYMTPEQREKAKKTNKVNTERLLAALRWLLHNNNKWKSKSINIESIRNELQNPIIIDTSKTYETSQDVERENMESRESFEIFFPDGTLSTLTGGQTSIAQYRDLIRAQKASGFDIALQCDLSKEAVSDYKDDNLVNACLLQFPYERGGMNETRIKGDGTYTTKKHVEDYVNHLCNLSLPQFHEDLFCLILYNMKMKQQMVQTAGWRVRHGMTAQTLSNDLTHTHIEEAIAARIKLDRTSAFTSHPGHKFMNTVDTIAKSVPHTNQAAKQALSQGEAIQFYYGQPSYFLTVTPDDNNSFLVQVYNWVVSDETNVNVMTNEQLKELAIGREALRVQFPGICALVFQMTLDIVYETVIGWNKDENLPTEAEGIFGKVAAVSASIEEQGRGTLHAHILIWTETFNDLRESLHDANRMTARLAEKQIAKLVDNLTNTELIGNRQATDLRLFPHFCTSDEYRTPRFSTDNQLRCLRHKDGYAANKNSFLSCQLCNWEWSNTDVVCIFLQHAKGIKMLDAYPDRSSRLKTMCIEYQKGLCELDKSVVRAAYDTHIHTRSCFKIYKKQNSGNTKRGLDDFECRFRYPRRKKQRTTVSDLGLQQTHWYSWRGICEMRSLKEINVKRADADAFQNESCTAIIDSKLACNTNIIALMPGPIAFYTFKYNMKGTQEEDEAQYTRISEAARRALSKELPENTAASIAVSRLLSGSFAHQKTNVIKASLASFLVRNQARFLFSHTSVWCPLSDILSILNGGTAATWVEQNGSSSFFNCIALHYLCRPLELENVSAYHYFARYQVVTKNKNTDGEIFNFYNGHYTHPSFSAKSKTFKQVVKERDRQVLVRFSQYLFPDSAEFNGDLLDPMLTITEATEKYSQTALLLFHPYREAEDLQLNSTYTQKLRQLFELDCINLETQRILQNIQNVRANATRVSNTDDDLRRSTVPYNRSLANAYNGYDSEENPERIEDNQQLDQLLHLLNLSNSEQTTNSGQNTPGSTTGIPHIFSFSNIRNRGRHGCGYNLLTSMHTATILTTQPFVHHTPLLQIQEPHIIQTNTDTTHIKISFTQQEIVKVLLERTSRRARTQTGPLNNRSTDDCLEANGSAASIFDWADKAQIDQSQKRAFEMFAASFILTFYKQATATSRTRIPQFNKEQKRLEMIVTKPNQTKGQLICLLHGPAGCGKTTVVDLLIEYARAFCDYLHDFKFTSNTIVVTAMSGVAATLLMGETTHSALYLNKKTELQDEEVEKFLETRLVIIDEISFASVNDIKKINKNLMELKQQKFQPFGGVHIIFSGDFRQLEPVGQGQQTIFNAKGSEMETLMNSYIELRGLHRFARDKPYGEILQRFRDGTVTANDINTINTRQVTDSNAIPDNCRYATFQNKDRDAINCALFAGRCLFHRDVNQEVDDAILIFSDNIQIKDSRKVFVPLKNYHSFWNTCTGCDVNPASPYDSGRAEPVLQIYRTCRVMLSTNISVTSGLANGTQALVKRVILKTSATPTTVNLENGTKINAVTASQVDYIELEHCNTRIQPAVFSIRIKEYCRNVNIIKPSGQETKGKERETIQMKFHQFPLLINNATTGHKLQGTGVDQLFVHEWKYGVKNYPYVVLSRVTTLQGLFLRKPLQTDLSKYSMPDNLSSFLQRVKQKHTITPWTIEQYADVLNYSYATL